MNSNSQDEIILKLGEQYRWKLTLEKYDIRSANFNYIRYTDEEAILEEPGKSITYKGVLNNNPRNQVRLVITKNSISGFIQDGKSRYHLSPIQDFIHDFEEEPSKQTMVVYKDIDYNSTNDLFCATVMSDSTETEVEVEAEEREDCIPNQERFLELAVESDYEYYLRMEEEANGNNNVEEPYDIALRKLLVTIAKVDEFYSRTLNIRVILNSYSLWETENDPYSSVSILTRWDQLRGHFNSNKTCQNRDVGILLSGRMGAGARGVANGNSWSGVQSICGSKFDTQPYVNGWNPLEFSYLVARADDVPAEVIAHELGHLFGEESHVDEPGCWLMSGYGACGNQGIRLTGSSGWYKDIINTGGSVEVIINEQQDDICGRLNEGRIFGAGGLNYPGIPMDNCLLDPAPMALSPDYEIGYDFLTGPNQMCIGDIEDFIFSYEGTNINPVWELGPGLSLVNGSLEDETITVESNSDASSFVKVKFNYNCEELSFYHEIHSGIPLIPSTPILTKVNDELTVGFWGTESADSYNYDLKVYNAYGNITDSESGSTNDPSELITIYEGECVEIAIVSVNDCGVSAPFPPGANSVTFCTDDIVAGFISNDNSSINEIERSKTLNSESDKLNGAYSSVYPNPAKNKINITFSSNVESYRILGATGKEVFLSENGQTREVSTEKWNNGLYIIQAENEKGEMEYLKFIIIKE